MQPGQEMHFVCSQQNSCNEPRQARGAEANGAQPAWSSTLLKQRQPELRGGSPLHRAPNRHPPPPEELQKALIELQGG